MTCRTYDEAFTHITNTYSKEILLDEKRLLALLSDIYPTGHVEKNILRCAFSIGIPSALNAACDNSQGEQSIVMANLVNKMVEGFAMREDIVESYLKAFAEALGWELNSPRLDGIEYLFTIGVNYRYGFNGFPVDLEVARTYLESAANNNHAEAAAVLAFLYYDNGEDEFIADNPIEYIRWLQKAADLDHDIAIKLIQSLETC